MLLLPEKASRYCTSTTSLPPVLPKFLRLGSQIFKLLHHEVAVGVLFDSDFVLYSINWLMVEVLFNLNALPLMRSRTAKHLPVYICRMELKHNEELYNDILGYLERLGIGWTVDVVESL